MSELLLTNSEMASWRRCHRKWYLSTYLRLKPRNDSVAGSALSIGNVVHEALASYYEPSVRADPAEAVRAIAARKLEERPVQEDAILKERELCLAMVEGYVDWLSEEGADQDVVVEGSESKVEVGLAPGLRLLSKLDAPIRKESDGARLALEHKTVSTLSDLAPLFKIDTQFLTEHLVRFLHELERGKTPEEAQQLCQGVYVNMLRKVKRTAAAKPPFYGREQVDHNLDQLRNHWRHVVAVGRQIEDARRRLDAGEDHHTVTEPSPHRNCSWDCAFFKICAMLDDGSDAEGAIEALYEEHDPLERYDDAQPIGE